MKIIATKFAKAFLIPLILQVIFSTCIDLPVEPKMPQWDVALTIPLIKNYTLGQIMDEAENSGFSYDPTRDSLILFKMNLNIDPINVSSKDNIKFKTTTINKRVLLSDIQFQPTQQFNFNNRINQIFPALPVNTNTIVPPISNISVSNDATLNSMSEIYADNGRISLVITNPFPIDLVFNRISIVNNSPNNTAEIGVITNKTIPKNSSITDTSIVITGKRISNIVGVRFTISTAGSNSTPVYLSGTDEIKISVNLINIKIRTATASLTQQSYSLNSTTSIENDGSINQATLKTGKLYITIDNYTALGSKLNFVFPEIKKNNQPVSISLNLNPNQRLSEQSFDLSQYTIYPASNSISPRIEVQTMSTGNNFVTINGTDSIHYSFRIDDIAIESFSGKIASNIRQTTSLPGDDINKYFQGEIQLSEVNLKININNGTNLPFELKNASISATNKKTGKTESLTIDYTVLQPKTTTAISLDPVKTTNFFNAFSKNNSFPTNIDFVSDILINTNGSVYTFSNNDVLSGNGEITVPFKMSIKNLSYYDTMELNLADSDKDQIDNFSLGKIFIKANNWFGFSSGFKIRFMDDKKLDLLTLPKLANTFYTINSANVDNSGNITSAVESAFEISITKADGDFNKIKNTKFIEIGVFMETPSTALVPFRRRDALQLNAYCSFGFTIKENKSNN